MIKRSVLNYSTNQEALHQASFTAMRGVDSSKAPTANDCVLDAVNLDVDYDGGLVLRKPLVFNKKHSGMHISRYLYDKETVLNIHSTDGIFSPTIAKCKFTDIYGNTHTTEPAGIPYADCFDWKSIKVSNTATSTLLTNVIVDLNTLEDVINEQLSLQLKLYNAKVEPYTQLRMLKLYKDEYGAWVLEMLTPEPATLTSDEISADFNTTLPYPLALRDNYFATQTSLKGILAYTTDFKDDLKTFTSEVCALRFFTRKTIFSYNSYVSISAEYNTDGICIYIPKTNLFRYINVLRSNGDLLKSYTGSLHNGIDTTDGILCIPYAVSAEYAYIKIHCGYYQAPIDASDITTVVVLTESVDSKLVSSVGDGAAVILKAFLDKPYVYGITDAEHSAFRNLGIVWEQSTDGIDWTVVHKTYSSPINIARKLYSTNSDLDSSDYTWEIIEGGILNLPDYKNASTANTAFSIHSRADCLTIDSVNTNYMYKCSLLKLKETSNADSIAGADVELESVLDERTYVFRKGTFETLTNTLKNPLSAEMLYWNHRLYAYSDELGSDIYVSNVDGAEFLMSNIIDLGTYKKGTVRKVIPWRDYIVAFTDNSVHLIQDQDVGFTTKVVNTFVGVPSQDANTCVSILNGIIFKSGNKIYTLSPNYSSGVDTILNISDVSKPIQHLLDKYSNNDLDNFAFTTSESYYLCLPKQNSTICLKYNYNSKVWTHHIIPEHIDYYEILDVENVVFYSVKSDGVFEYFFEKDIDFAEDVTYGDVLSDDGTTAPISFYLDSGQKTDNISLTKQFVESKIIVATLDPKDTFNMSVQIEIDGNTFKKHTDLNTDGALLRKASDDILTLGTSSEYSEAADTLNVLRQMFLRYSGKGKTIRHIISGESLYRFKIYETFYRYKLLNFKQ